MLRRNLVLSLNPLFYYEKRTPNPIQPLHMKTVKPMSVMDGFKKYGIKKEAELHTLEGMEPTKLELGSVLGSTEDKILKHGVRALIKSATMFDEITPTMHLFQNLTDMPVSAGKWMLKGLLKENEYSLFFGEPGSRKSFLLLDMALHLSNNRDWCGHKTKIAPTVLYLVGEGQGGINLRLKAASQRHNLPHDKILVSKLPGALMDDDSVNLIANAIESIDGPVWLIVDTLHRNLGDGDENASRDFGIVLQNLDNHIKALGATVTIVHHTGHGNKDRSRGSSSIRGALDSEFLVEKNDTLSNLICTKMKDSEFAPKISLQSHIETLGEDEDGDLITSLSLTQTTHEETQELTENEEIILGFIRVHPASFGDLKKQLSEPFSEDGEETIKSRLKRALGSLTKKGLIASHNKVYSLLGSQGSIRVHVENGPSIKIDKNKLGSQGSHTYRCEPMNPNVCRSESSTFIFDHDAAMNADIEITLMQQEA